MIHMIHGYINYHIPYSTKKYVLLKHIEQQLPKINK